MSLKEQVPNVYGVGINSVGSYRVSGVPHISSLTIADLEEKVVSFPDVTKNIILNKTSTGGEARVYFVPKGTQKKALQFNDLSPTDGFIDNFFTIPLGVGEQDTFTFSMWFKANVARNGQNAILYSPGGSHGPSQTMKIMSLQASNPSAGARFRTQLKDRVLGNTTPQLDVTLPYYNQTEFVHYLISVGSTKYEVYVNGSKHGSSGVSIPNGIDDMPNIQFPRAMATPLTLAQFTFWDKPLDSNEVSELYNNGHYLNPQSHSAATNLSSWFIFDNTVASNPDTSTKVFDRVGNLTGSVINSGGQSNSATYVDGPGNFQTGSTSITNMHYLTLTDDRPTMTLNCKCKEIYLMATGSSQTVNVTANLTNIPASKMFALTGSGIDE